MKVGWWAIGNTQTHSNTQTHRQTHRHTHTRNTERARLRRGGKRIRFGRERVTFASVGSGRACVCMCQHTCTLMHTRSRERALGHLLTRERLLDANARERSRAHTRTHANASERTFTRAYTRTCTHLQTRTGTHTFTHARSGDRAAFPGRARLPATHVRPNT